MKHFSAVPSSMVKKTSDHKQAIAEAEPMAKVGGTRELNGNMNFTGIQVQVCRPLKR